MRSLFLSYFFLFIACVLILSAPIVTLPSTFIGIHGDNWTAAGSIGPANEIHAAHGSGRMLEDEASPTEPVRRILKGGGEVMGMSDASVAGMYYVGDDSPVPGLVWLCLSSSIFVMMPYVAFCMFTPFEKLNIFLLSVGKMLKNGAW